MAISKVAQSVFTVAAGSGANSISLPGTLAENDIVFVAIACDNGLTGSEGFTSGTDYTLLSSAGTTPARQLGYKLMGSTPDSTVSISSDAATVIAGVIRVYRGVDPGTPIDATPASNDYVTQDGGISNSPLPPPYTTVTADALRLVWGFLDDDDDAAASAAPSGYSDFLAADTGQANTNDLGATVMVASKAAPSPGSDTPGRFTSSADSWHALHFALRPAAGAGGVDVAPGVASLTLAAQTPTVAVTANQNVSPGAASLSLTAFAPTVAVSADQNVSPGLATLTLAGQTPTVLVSANQNVSPGLASLTLTPQAPTVTATANQDVSPGTASLTLAPQTPTVTASDNKSVTPGAASLSLTGQAPTVSTTANVAVSPGAASLTLAGQAPTVAATANVNVSPDAASLTLTGYAPTVEIPTDVEVSPGAAELVLTAFAPTVVASGSRARGWDDGGPRQEWAPNQRRQKRIVFYEEPPTRTEETKAEPPKVKRVPKKLVKNSWDRLFGNVPAPVPAPPVYVAQAAPTVSAAQMQRELEQYLRARAEQIDEEEVELLLLAA